MIKRLKKFFARVSGNRAHEAEHREKMARLEAVEDEAKNLRERGEVATTYLLARSDRNHWGESITIMIQGGRQS